MYKIFKSIIVNVFLICLVFTNIACEPELTDLSLQGDAADISSEDVIDINDAVESEPFDSIVFDPNAVNEPVEVVESIAVTVNGGDFEPYDAGAGISNSGGYVFWRWVDRGDYSNNPFASTSTGSDGGRGAKWDAAHSRLNSSIGDVRISYQAFEVTPNASYIIEFDYRVDTAGDYVEVLVLDGYYDSPVTAIASTPLFDASGADSSGGFVTQSVEFTTNSSGEISVMLSAFIADSAAGLSVYLDNMSIYPVQ